MTKEEKANAYDEAIKKINSKWHYKNKPCFIDVAEIFPELKESDDERIRKELIEFVDNNTLSVEERHYRWIDWLEKQGETSPIHSNSSNIGKDEQKPALPSVEEQEGVAGRDYIPVEWVDAIESYGKWKIVRVYEQNPTDKVKSKFKIGDWIVRNYRNSDTFIQKVVGVKQFNEESYGYELDDGTYFSGTFEKLYHLWTIKDAKDGDVLADNYGIYIFDRFDEYDERCYFCKGAYQYSQKVYENEHMLCSVEVHPATKEQREQLFQKMKEAGYEWDSEKKKLKKVNE